MDKVEKLHNQLKPEGVYVWPFRNFGVNAMYMKRNDVFRVTIDIPASQISDKRDVRAIFGDGDCKLIPVLAFVDK